MNTLEMYKKLSDEDKINLTDYCIYNSIYTISKENNYMINDEEVDRIRELTDYLYLKDDYYNLSVNRISDFITECYESKNITLEELASISWSELLSAIDENDYDFYNEEEMER